MYEKKYSNFLRMIEVSSPGDVVTIVDPTVIGDDYTELVENLRRIAQADLTLKIIHPKYINK
ncbi:MAG TPA: hypothetical protein DD473_16225 [Planctomycetaceae bacterium]|nr:hypothetical protein [Planctomycetaceae bacterium]